MPRQLVDSCWVCLRGWLQKRERLHPKGSRDLATKQRAPCRPLRLAWTDGGGPMCAPRSCFSEEPRQYTIQSRSWMRSTLENAKHISTAASGYSLLIQILGHRPETAWADGLMRRRGVTDVVCGQHLPATSLRTAARSCGSCLILQVYECVILLVIREWSSPIYTILLQSFKQ